MQLFPDSTPHYVTDASERAQPVRNGNGGLFGGCGFLGLSPKAPQYVGTSQPVGCPSSGLFDVAQPHYVQPESRPSTTVARSLPPADRTLADLSTEKPKAR